MTIKIKLLALVWLVPLLQVVAQTVHYSVCSVDAVRSQNNNYFLQTSPFDNIQQSTTGKTVVYKADSTKLYEIDRHFELNPNKKEIFLSNDAKTVVYVIDREFEYNNTINNSIEIFKDGTPVKTFQLNDLINCDSDEEDCYLFYKEAIDTITWNNGNKQVIYKANATDFEKQLTERATFLAQDALYIFTKDNTLLTLNLNTLQLESTPAALADVEKIRLCKPVALIKEKEFKTPLLSLPTTLDGTMLIDALAKDLDMVIHPDKEKYKAYRFNLSILVDKNGNAVVDKIETYDTLPEDKIRAFVASQKFEATRVPTQVDKWRFNGWIALMNKDKSIAKRERKDEIAAEREAHKKRLVTDSINGIYIPKNIEDCFLQLNKMLKPKEIQVIKNLKNRAETNNYHFGFGMWLRNNWGLWGGSRLQLYFFSKGIDHPDSMSSTILQFYYDWLNEQHEGWKNFDTQ